MFENLWNETRYILNIYYYRIDWQNLINHIFKNYYIYLYLYYIKKNSNTHNFNIKYTFQITLQLS